VPAVVSLHHAYGSSESSRTRLSLPLGVGVWLLYGVTVVVAFFALMAGGLREPSEKSAIERTRRPPKEPPR